MEYKLIDKENVTNKLIQFGVVNGDEIIVTHYLTSRDPEAQAELYQCLHECMDEMGLVDVNIMGEWIQIHIDDPKRTEFDFTIRFWRKAEETDIGYKAELRQAKHRAYRF